MRAPIGLKIATRRKALGISQAALARQVEISPSYLNLIEANKRQVGGMLLARIAAELEVDLDALTGEAEHRLMHELVEAFADPVLAGSNMGLDEARALVATAPETAQLIARLYRAYGTANANADAYANRLRADPLLSQLLHQILSGITAVRAGAEILEDIEDLSGEERQRFIGSITRETKGLSAVARNLIGQFDQASSARRSASIRREVDDMIFAAQNYFPDLEASAEALRARIDRHGPFSETTLQSALETEDAIVVRRATRLPAELHEAGRAFGFDEEARTLWFRNTVPQSTRQFQMARLFAQLRAHETLDAIAAGPALTSAAARRMARRYLGSYLAGAIVFPYDAFLADARAQRYDVDALAERYNASFEQIAHRLVTLRREDDQGIPFGFLRADPAGRLTKHFPIPGLLLPHTGHACPLWALYSAFRTPGAVVRQVARFSDGSRFLFIAKAVTRRSSGFADQALPHSILLVTDILHADETVYADGLDLTDAQADIPVGPTCRLCTRSDCASRQEDAWAPGGADLPAHSLAAVAPDTAE
ncbi:helix-turn-helix domain-containing protein [Pelagibacterium xiamenense]|uniref:helix-turn-helix domain-containing protein n=1 Tax=Pelagibacterium xiamenense TaxID=2901140 RepID=UPI001E56C81D|nr:XRE family transcriptional regulator [Pelagibacterium xiamenense]MCD7059832.1 short-chain fatty acyl-CoA regulator family protein [Pelagibacterium xiamenense]